VAGAEIFKALHKPIAATLRKRRSIAWDVAVDLATDAIVSYLKTPARFDPNRASLFTYLVMIADRDALNYIRDSATEHKNIRRVVELERSAGNTHSESPQDRLDAETVMERHRDELVSDPEDERVLRLMLEGEQETAEYARALGIDDRSKAEQRRLVKQRRDRLEKRLLRLREKVERER
jgi:RNA polymerase sigma factor (sigma-70 family)